VFTVDIFCPTFTYAWMQWTASLTGGKYPIFFFLFFLLFFYSYFSHIYFFKIYLTPRKYIPLKQATHLAPVIIAGCREELQLKKLQHEVVIEVESLQNDKKTLNEINNNDEALSSKIAERLNSRGIALLRVDIEQDISEETQQMMAVIDLCFTLPEAKENLEQRFKSSRTRDTRETKKKNMKAEQAQITPAQVLKILLHLRAENVKNK